jgi:serine/threonine-protein phosphatase 2B catalytic subunit
MTVCASEQVIQRRQVLRRKVVVIGRLANCYRLLKEHPELVKQLKSLSNGKIPAGTLSKGEKGLRDGK